MSMYRSEEERRALIEAYLRERQGYIARDLPDRVEQVDRMLERLGHTVGPAYRRAERRPRRRGEER